MRKRILFSLLCVLCITSFAFPGIQTVQNIAFSLPGTYYYANGQFTLNAAGYADVQTYDSPVDYNYSILNLTADISVCGLKQNRSTAQGRAIGDFWGGGTLTVTGDLMRRAADGSTYGDVLYSGTILVADMVKTSTEYWTLSETGNNTNQVSAALALTGANGGLHSGITFGSDKMIIGDMSIKMQFMTPGITTFGADSSLSAVPVLQIVADIPEPATLLLLALGGLGLVRKNK